MLDEQERKYEEERLLFVRKEIIKQLKVLESSASGLSQDVISLKKTFWDDVKVNMDNPEEASETLASIKQQAELLSERERNQEQLHKQFRKLTRLKDSPYFARVDFLSDDDGTVTHVYLGVASLVDEEKSQHLIYDWRAPISSIYYDYSTGPAQYETIDGVVQGEMTLKRQFLIQDGQMKTMFDTNIIIGDELLKNVLGHHASTNMKSIVATIQREQNQIIRNVTSKYLIVQGVAGSGKTSAALQRVAFLLYRYKDEITAENIMLFSPNSLFNSYVASVLPDLGEENMQQMTFHQYVEKRLGKQFDIEQPAMQIESMLTCENEDLFAVRNAGIQYKASLDFKVLLDTYIQRLSTEGLIFKKIAFQGKVLIEAEQISHYFYSLDSALSIAHRLQFVKEWLLKELVKKEREEMKEEWVAEESDLLDLEEYTNVYSELLQKGHFTEDSFGDFQREQRKIAKTIVQKHFKPIRTAIKKLKFLHLTAIYKQLFDCEWGMPNLPKEWNEICFYTIKQLKKKKLMYEDAAPYLYLMDKLEGQRMNPNIRHLFIDEAQDYSPIQLCVLQQLFPSCRMTILGDFNQSIYMQSFHNHTLLSNELYEDENYEKVTLMKSYRSTQQIVRFTKEILEGTDEIEPFNRDGSKPTFTQVDEVDLLHRQMMKRIHLLQSANYETIAIICKTKKECQSVYLHLNEVMDIQFMDDTATAYKKGILILPVYLAKGIEFDAVIIYDASSQIYTTEYDRGLFYTACTRAMHELHIFSLGVRNPYMEHISESLYENGNMFN